MTRSRSRHALTLLFLLATADAARAQVLGTFRWNVAPYCSVLTLTVTQQGSVFTLDGYEEQCGGNPRLPTVGIAAPQADGTIRMGLTGVNDQGHALHTIVFLSPVTLGGTWKDEANSTGTFVFSPASTSGGPRTFPAPSTSAGSGQYSVAMGYNAHATSYAAVALGNETLASGGSSTALGYSTTASGGTSVAMGSHTTAEGSSAIAMGDHTIAGHFGIAMGSYVTNNGFDGSFIFGDRSTTSFFGNTATNQFMARAINGYRLFTNTTATTGVAVAPGGGSWASVSDVNMKTGFRDLDGQDVLARLARMPIREWSYTSQDASIRHAGPTAQDFHAAFGLGEDPLKITTVDADGIALRAIQALEQRSRDVMEKIAALEAELARLRTGERR